MANANKQLVEARTADLVRVLLDGCEPDWDLCEYVREQEQESGSCWHVGEGDTPLSYSQIRRYAVRAEKLIGESCRASRKRLMRRHLAQRRNLYAKAVNQGDLRTALACADSEAELLKLYDPPAVKPKPGEADKPLTPADVLLALSRCLAQVEATKMDDVSRAKLVIGLGDSLLQAVNVENFSRRLDALEAAAQRDRR